MTGSQREMNSQQDTHLWRMQSTPDAQDICERLLGVTFPVEQQVLVISYEGVHVVDLDGSWHVQHDTRYPEGRGICDWKNQRVTYKEKQFQILSASGKQSSLHNAYGERLVFTHKKHRLPGQMTIKQTFHVLDKQGSILLEYAFDDFSGDWMNISFSADSNAIVLASPYHFCVFERTAS